VYNRDCILQDIPTEVLVISPNKEYSSTEYERDVSYRPAFWSKLTLFTHAVLKALNLDCQCALFSLDFTFYCQ